jgi:hypothetical protein
VRQLAAAFSPASLLAATRFQCRPPDDRGAGFEIRRAMLAGGKAAASCRTLKLRTPRPDEPQAGEMRNIEIAGRKEREGVRSRGRGPRFIGQAARATERYDVRL